MTAAAVRAFLIRFLVAGAIAAALLAITTPPPAVPVNVEWGTDVDEDGRIALERRYSLTLGTEIDGRIWGYSLTDYSAPNIRALIEDPGVESTLHLDRRNFTATGANPGSRAARIATRAIAAGLVIALLLTLGPRGTAPLDGARAWWKDVVFLLILLGALVLRIQLATTEPYIHDEENTSIPLSKTISFRPGEVHLPLRGENHPALPVYVVKASGAFFGNVPAGYRSLHLLLSLCTVLLVYLLARDWFGVVAARWASAIVAFNEYYLGVSARATAHVPHLFLVTGAMYAYSRFVREQRATYLYAAAAAVGLAFYTKEHSALLLPIFFLALLFTPQRRWLLTPHPYLACVLFAAVISPDLYWNLTTTPDRAETAYAGQTVRQATYGSHLKRLGGLGYSPYPAMFYARPVVKDVHLRATGTELKDETREYRSVNPAIGLLLVGAVLVSLLWRRKVSDLQTFLLIQFCFVFAFFSAIKAGDAPGRLDPVSWIWVETTIFPAAILAGARLAEATGWKRIAAWTLAGAALVYAAISVISGQ